MVDVARFFLEFVAGRESCGKCAPCRVGTKRMLEILTASARARARKATSSGSIDLGEMIKDTSLCGLGQTAPNPVLSTIRHFRHEYGSHIRDKHCQAGVCATLFKAPCPNACPADVDIPGFVSLVGEKRYAEALRAAPRAQPVRRRSAPASASTPARASAARRRSTRPSSIRGVKRFMVDQETDDPAARGARRATRTPSARSPSSAPARPACPAPTSSPGWATGRQSSRPSRGPAACSCRRFRPTACRARSSPARSA